MDMPYSGHLDACNIQFEEGSGIPDGGQPVVAGNAIGLSLYPRLMSILTSTDDLEPRVKSIGWVLKLMDGIYDARRRAEQASFAAEEDFFNLDAGSRKHASFPAFAYQHVKNRHGIVHMVRSVCLDLVCNVQFYRSQNPEVEVFARFLEEFYGPKELAFFLDLRAEAHRVARVCAKQKAAAQTVWMTLPDCVRVAKEVFLDKSTLYFRDLIATVEMQMARLPPGGAWPSHDRRRRISLSDFLYLAMVCFVSPKEPACQGRPRREGPASASGRRVYHGGGGGGGSACGGSRKVGKARTANGHDDCFGGPSPASYLASGDRRCFRPSPESTSSGGGESDPATIETGQSTARGSVLSFGKKLFVGGDERCPDAAERGIWATPKALETVATKAFEASELERHVSMAHNLALETETPEGARREDGGGSIHSATEGHPAYSGQRTDRLFFAVEGERRGASEEGRRDGNGRLASNTQQAPLAFTSASSGSSTCVNGAIIDEAGGEGDKDEKNTEISASGGSGGGREALCGPGGGQTVVAERRPSLAEPDRQLVEVHPSCRRANTGDGGDVKSADDLRAAACIRLSNATGVGEGEREPKGRETERLLSSNFSAHRQAGMQSAETRPRPRSAAGLVPPPIAEAPPMSQQDASLIRKAFPGGGTERSIPRNSERKPGASGDWNSHRSVENDLGGTWEIEGEVRRQAEISEGRRPVEDQAELDGKADPGDDDSDEPEIRSDVLVMATEWFASFERRFLPSLAGAAASAAEASAVGAAAGNNLGTRNGGLPAPIARVLSEEMVRVLALRRRDLDAVAHHSPQLLSDAVAKAFWTLEDAVSTASTHSRALCNMGRLLEDRKNADAALLCFQEASTVDTTSAEALCGRARNLQRRGDLDGAAFYFEGALARDESHWPAWYGLGQVKAEQGKHADAAEAFLRWVDGGKTDNGISGGREGGHGRAVASRARGLVQLGDAQREIGQDTNAQRSYERAISVDKSLPAAHFKLGSLLQARGGHEAEALEAFARAVRAAGGKKPG